jgi:hypothetical protein
MMAGRNCMDHAVAVVASTSIRLFEIYPALRGAIRSFYHLKGMVYLATYGGWQDARYAFSFKSPKPVVACRGFAWVKARKVQAEFVFEGS